MHSSVRSDAACGQYFIKYMQGPSTNGHYISPPHPVMILFPFHLSSPYLNPRIMEFLRFLKMTNSATVSTSSSSKTEALETFFLEAFPRSFPLAFKLLVPSPKSFFHSSPPFGFSTLLAAKPVDPVILPS